VTESIQRRFLDVARGAAADTHGWLTFVRGENG